MEANTVRTVLLVDDSPEDLRRYELLLRAWGFNVVAVASPEEAMEAITRNADIDIVLTNYLMPGMNGIELTHALKQVQGSLRIIILTSGPYQDITPTAIAAGAQKVLPKGDHRWLNNWLREELDFALAVLGLCT